MEILETKIKSKSQNKLENKLKVKFKMEDIELFFIEDPMFQMFFESPFAAKEEETDNFKK
jgi:hypothetical protein